MTAEPGSLKGDAAPLDRLEESNRPVGKPRRWTVSLTATLAIGIGLLVAVAAGAVLILTIGATARNTFDLLEDSAILGLDVAEAQLRANLDPVADQMTYLGQMAEIGLLSPDDMEASGPLAAGALAATPQVLGIALWSAEKPTTYYIVPQGIDSADEIVLLEEVADLPSSLEVDQLNRRQSGVYWSDLVWIEEDQAPGLNVRAPLRRDGDYLGGIASVVTVRELSRFIGELDIGIEGNRGFLLYGPGRVIAHPLLATSDDAVGRPLPNGQVELPELQSLGDPVLARLAERNVPFTTLEENGGRIIEIALDGGEQPDYIILTRPLLGYAPRALILGIVLPIESVNDELERLVVALMAGAILVVLAVLAGMFLGRWISRPIRRFAEHSEAIARLEIDDLQQLPGSRFRELNAQSQAFNTMLDALRWLHLYVPKSLVRRLMRREDAETVTRSQERMLTVLFTDIEGFTSASEGQEAVRVAAWLNRHFTLIDAAIEAEGGTLDKYIGDGVLAFWGAPDEEARHADRACRAALAIGRAVAEDNARLIADGFPPIRLRLGLHTGPVLVGNIGAPSRLNYTIVGDTVNTGDRLQSIGRSHDVEAAFVIIVSDEVVSALSPETLAQFDLEDLGEQEVRGRNSSLRLYQLRGK